MRPMGDVAGFEMVQDERPASWAGPQVRRDAQSGAGGWHLETRQVLETLFEGVACLLERHATRGWIGGRLGQVQEAVQAADGPALGIRGDVLHQNLGAKTRDTLNDDQGDGGLRSL